MTRTRSFVAAVVCSLLLSSVQGDKAPERRTYLRRLMDDGLASGLTKLEHLMTASVVSGTGSDSATAAKATAGGQENAAKDAAAKKDSTSSSTATSSTSTSTVASGTTDGDSVATDDDDDDSSSTSGGGGGQKAAASPPPNLSANVTKTEESAADWYDDDGSPTLSAGGKAEAPSGSAGGASASASAGSTSGSAAGTNTTLPNGRAHRDANNPHAAEMKRNNPKGDHTSTNDDDDVGYVHYNSTSNEDYVVGDDDDAPKTAADAIVSDLSKKSKKMNMGTREGYVAVFVVLMAAAGFGIYVANKHCQRMIKQRRRSGYQSIE